MTGRFTTRDTVFGDLADSQSQNRYVYCLNNPHKYIDPDGHIVITATLVLWTAFGGAVGLNAYGAYNHLVRNNGNIETAGNTYNWWEAVACTVGGAAIFGGGYWTYEAIIAATSAGGHQTVYDYISSKVNSLGSISTTPEHMKRASKYFGDMYGQTTKMTSWAKSTLTRRLLEWSQGSADIRLVERLNADGSKTWAIAEKGCKYIIMWGEEVIHTVMNNKDAMARVLSIKDFIEVVR